MKWVCALSTKVSLEAAVQEVAQRVLADLEGLQPDFGLLFVSTTFSSDAPRLLPLLAEQITIPHLIGCSGGGIMANGDELEDKPAISLMVGHLPGAKLKTFHLTDEIIPDLDSSPERWQELIGVDQQLEPSFILLADPFSFPINDFLAGMDFAYPNQIKVGGLASGGGMNMLFCDRPGDGQSSYRLVRQGLVGAALWGDLTIDAVVAQGCRPIGKTLQISQSDRNIILAIENRPPLEVLQAIVNDLSESDQALAETSLFMGVMMNEFKLQPERGDFLIRNIVGVDPRNGAIAIGDRVRPGQRIQLHLRDAEASASDLSIALSNYQQRSELVSPGQRPEAALLFSCMGRGERLYGEAGFDSGIFLNYFEHLPLSGFFCSGEIGPVTNTTFLHGYTSVFGILRSRNGASAPSRPDR
ncbi:MAG: FIST C-terminal domain-containing protein [Pseudanabaenaceae cyanobacterium bins.68]|nr:FIST C-terminal domain-containing protein [Pseudanabaenaceae cyanobacterium bins.68]